MEESNLMGKRIRITPQDDSRFNPFIETSTRTSRKKVIKLKDFHFFSNSERLFELLVQEQEAICDPKFALTPEESLESKSL